MTVLLKAPRPINDGSMGNNENNEMTYDQWNLKSPPSLHFSTIVNEICRIFNLNQENSSL